MPTYENGKWTEPTRYVLHVLLYRRSDKSEVGRTTFTCYQDVTVDRAISQLERNFPELGIIPIICQPREPHDSLRRR